MTAISRYLFPPMLKTTNLPTESALLNVLRTSVKLSHFARFTIWCHASRGDLALGYRSQNSRSFFFEMMCISVLPKRIPRQGWIRSWLHLRGVTPVGACDPSPRLDRELAGFSY